MPETTVERSEVVTETVTTPEGSAVSTPPLTEQPSPPGAQAPDPAAISAATEAIAVGAVIGEQVGRQAAAADQAQAAAAQATSTAASLEQRLADAEATRDRLAARVAELETPPASEEPTTATDVVVDTTPATPAADTPAPTKARTLFGKIFLGEV